MRAFRCMKAHGTDGSLNLKQHNKECNPNEIHAAGYFTRFISTLFRDFPGVFVPSVSVFYFVLVTFGANIGSSLIAMRRGGIMCEGIVKKSILAHRQGWGQSYRRLIKLLII